MAVNIFSDDNFKTEVLESNVPVLVDFWAPWCGPCKMQGPIVEDLAKDFEGKNVKIGKMNTDENPNTPGSYHIMSIPTLMIYKNGEVAEQMVGVHDKATLAAKLEALMS